MGQQFTLEFILQRYESNTKACVISIYLDKSNYGIRPNLLIINHSFQVSIVKLKMDKDRKLIIDRRAKGRAAATGKDKGKYTEETAAATMETA